MKNGDVVTRDGTDRHRVEDIDDEGRSAIFLCIRAPLGRWINKGEREINLCRRYTLVTDGKNKLRG